MIMCPSMTWAKSMLCAFMHENLTFCTKQSYLFFFFFCVRDYGPRNSAESEMLSFVKYMFFPKLYLKVLVRSCLRLLDSTLDIENVNTQFLHEK